MLDMSRNAVMKVDQLKNFMKTIKKMGYNALLLYCEDTYEVEGEPYFGYMRGRYSIAEMKEIDSFGQSIKMEVIPCIQTLAHLETTTRWKQFPTDNDRTMMVGEERCYELLMWSDMFFTNGYYHEKIEMPRSYIDALPKSVKSVYWDYYHVREKNYDDMIYNHKQLSKDFWFASPS